MTSNFQIQTRKMASSKAEVLVLLVANAFADSALVVLADQLMGGALLPYLKKVDFQPLKGGVVDVPTLGTANVGRVILVGVRPQDCGSTQNFSNSARLTEATSLGVRTALNHTPASIEVFADSDDVRALALGLGLGAYKFQKYMSKPTVMPKTVELCVSSALTAAQKKSFAVGLKISRGVCMARDLVNEPPNELTPAEFAARARAVAKENKLSAKILNHAGIKKAGMNLHDAVGKGSENEPYFIHLTYSPARPQGKIAFIGKGLTFDSGGICIKPAPGMGDMKSDMGGGAAVLGLMEAIAALELPIEVHGIIGAAENMPDAKAYRPSDVIVGLAGKGVEVINTDAEGRLVLADALTYAARLKPDFMVDAATLTGATLLSLSPSCSAFFTGHDEIAEAMKAASDEAGESFWRMPLIEELAAQLKSPVTDLQHTGERMGGAITAALFLREFTEGVPWMHCDIPGAVYRDRPSGMHPKGGTGHAVMTFLKLAEAHANSPVVQGEKAKVTPLRPRTKKAAVKPSGARATTKKRSAKKAARKKA